MGVEKPRLKNPTLMWGLAVASLLSAVVAGAVFLRRSRSATELKTPATSMDRARVAREQYVATLLQALRAAVLRQDSRQAEEALDLLVREGEAAVLPVAHALKGETDPRLSAALLLILERTRLPSSVAVLANVYRDLDSGQVARRRRVAQHLARIGGTTVRQILLEFMRDTNDPALREELAKLLIQTGVMSSELAAWGGREREDLEARTARAQGTRERVQLVAGADPRTDSGFEAIRKVALEETTIAVAVEAFRKLEKANDERSVATLVERVSQNPASGGESLIRLNALTSLAKMTSTAARKAVRDLGLGADQELRLTTIELVGGFGDPAMIPLLDQAKAKDGSPAMAKAVERAHRAIEARAAAAGMPCCGNSNKH